jgi:hypothetical protein
MKKSLWCLLPVLALCLVAAAKKEPGVTVRFYEEGVAGDINTLPDPIYLQDPSRKIYRAKTASISESDIAAIYPFQTNDGSIGCVFILNDAGKAALDTLSVEKRGSSLTAIVNDRMIINLLIDRRIPDGILVIPHGMTVQEGLLLKKTFKVLSTTPLATPKPTP